MLREHAMRPVAHAADNLHTHPGRLALRVVRLLHLVLLRVAEPALLVAVADLVPGLAMGWPVGATGG